MYQLPLVTWIRFLAWLGLGLLLYAGYGYWHSVQRRSGGAGGAGGNAA
jgi:APA family basic amino acid/polyamine antiporter